ncbi:MAG: hypothetical protein KDD69_03675, partial [Bdellovibrionales bacterium]|nr:hypothetical protein [Bdellovibrionales bacterium]
PTPRSEILSAPSETTAASRPDLLSGPAGGAPMPRSSTILTAPAEPPTSGERATEVITAPQTGSPVPQRSEFLQAAPVTPAPAEAITAPGQLRAPEGVEPKPQSAVITADAPDVGRNEPKSKVITGLADLGTPTASPSSE